MTRSVQQNAADCAFLESDSKSMFDDKDDATSGNTGNGVHYSGTTQVGGSSSSRPKGGNVLDNPK